MLCSLFILNKKPEPKYVGFRLMPYVPMTKFDQQALIKQIVLHLTAMDTYCEIIYPCELLTFPWYALHHLTVILFTVILHWITLITLIFIYLFPLNSVVSVLVTNMKKSKLLFTVVVSHRSKQIIFVLRISLQEN